MACVMRHSVICFFYAFRLLELSTQTGFFDEDTAVQNFRNSAAKHVASSARHGGLPPGKHGCVHVQLCPRRPHHMQAEAVGVRALFWGGAGKRGDEANLTETHTDMGA